MKKFLATLLIACMLSSPLSSLALAAVPQGEGTTFTTDELWNKFGDDLYYTNQRLNEMFHTVEAWIYFDGTSSTANGMLIGNYDQSGGTYVNVGVQSGHPRIYYTDGVNDYYNVRFDTVNVITGEWVHMVLINDPKTHMMHCYINGELAESKGFYPDFDNRTLNQYFVIGGDLRRLNTDYFKGGLQELNLYADVRTPEEIKSDYLTSKINTKDTDLLAAWDFSAENAKTDIKDRSAYNVDLTYSNMWLTEQEVDALHDPDFERAYSFAVVGDTQMVTLHAPDQLPKIYDWILANQEKENIQYAIGLGDITDKNTLAEWETAYAAITKMNGKLPYSVIRGNHDMLRSEGSVHDNSGINYFDQYFLNDTTYTAQFAGTTGGKYTEDSVFYTWTTFSPEDSDVDWLILNLDYMPSDEVLDWAAGIVEDHPTHKVII
ncbi:MAG: metallophosphoesterase, partial [Clostridia bacterium]|nr:metallophosphoesterase [Clostridia bacterium]